MDGGTARPTIFANFEMRDPRQLCLWPGIGPNAFADEVMILKHVGWLGREAEEARFDWEERRSWPNANKLWITYRHKAELLSRAIHELQRLARCKFEVDD